MFQVARNDYRLPTVFKQRGIALLVMLAIILVAFTTIAISRLSLNSAEQNTRARTTQALAQSKDAILAFALAPGIPGVNPPGTLPCPDGNADGRSDTRNAAGRCPQRRGLVPFRDLNIPRPLDGTGAPIWYVVADEYSRALIANEQRNSSSPTTLRLNVTLPMAFILFAPNKPIGTQVRANPIAPLATQATQFLEGDNADNSTPDSYTSVRDDSVYDTVADTQNDQVLGMPAGEFWSLVEGVVLKEVGNHLRQYRNAGCGYPWAAPANNKDNLPQTMTFEGLLPLAATWSGTCAAATDPAPWVNTHWGNLLYYAICLGSAATPPNPPLIPCLELNGNSSNNDAEAIVISPGMAFQFQTRQLPTQTPREFPTRDNLFEGENNTPGDNVYSKVKLINHSDAFNDVIHIVR